MPNFVLNKSILSEEEQSSILSALHGLSKIEAGEAKHTLDKLSTIFNKTSTNWLEVDFSDWWSYGNNDFETLKDAILKRHIIKFEYFNSRSEKALRRVEPMQLYFKEKSWYLKAFCLDKNAMRIYKLLRMRNLQTTYEQFNMRDIDDLDEDSEEMKWINLKLHIQPEMTYRIYEDFYDKDIKRQEDGSFFVDTKTVESNWLYGHLLSYGKYVEVLEPKHMREKFIEEVEEVLKRYL